MKDCERRTQRLILREWRESDRIPFARMNLDSHVMTYFPATLTPSESDAAIDRFRAAYDRDGFGLFAVELRATGEFAGVIGAQMMPDMVPNLAKRTVEIAWRLRSSLHGQGHATEGARETVEFCFRQLNLPEVVAITAIGNLPSRRVMEKLGMVHRADLDLEHPLVPPGHPHRRHALYHLGNPLLNATGSAQ